MLSDYIQKIPEDSQGRLKAILGPDKLFIASLHNEYQVEAKDSQSVLSKIIDILGKVENLHNETRLGKNNLHPVKADRENLISFTALTSSCLV